MLTALVLALYGTTLTGGCTRDQEVSGLDRPRTGPAVEVVRQTERQASNSIRLGVYRLTGTGGAARVSSGIPLPPGFLFPGQTEEVRILVAGEEPAVHLEALQSFHPDGSLRAILVQFETALANNVIPAELRYGESRTQPDPGRVDVQLTLTEPWPEAVILPSDPALLISTDVVGPTVDKMEADRFEPTWQRRFHQFGDPKWAVHEKDYLTIDHNLAIDRNFYDRALAEFAYWARTADVEHFRRAILYAVTYREKYHRKYDYKVQPQNSMIEGEALLYLLLGDEEGRRGARLNAIYFRDAWLPKLTDPVWQYSANRPMARTIEAFLTARLVQAGGGDWEASLRQALDAFLAHQSPDGAYRYPAQCSVSNNFQTGLFNDALIRYWEEFEKDPRILNAIRLNTDWMWTTQWSAAGSGFKYSEAACTKPGAGATETPAPDLNLLMVNAFGFLYQQLGDPKYLIQGDQVFRLGIKHAWLGGTALQGNKQFNQQYRSAYRYLFYRQGRAAG
jgi:hypothetical protein